MTDRLREALGRPVAELRELLQQALGERLLGRYGIDPRTGDRRPSSSLMLDEPSDDLRRRIIETLDHYEARERVRSAKDARAEAVARFLRESAYTHLNRLVALKMFEHDSRKALHPCLAGGREAFAFRQFRKVAEEWVASRAVDEGLAPFLDLISDELSVEVDILFDNDDSCALLDLPPDALSGAIARLNRPELEWAWSSDETLGWVYQLFTSAKQRQESREKHRPGPPSSEHLAFRNQFYTPRYVVEFLVDNTLGRLWCEMHPDSPQRNRRALLCIAPNEALPRREVRDPRTLRIIDPACGSGHFLLYCFDVLTEIYEEFGTPACDIPSLIIGENLHGIEIDLRAAQIAALALDLRARRYLHEHGLSDTRIPQARIILAEPLPAEKDLWDELLERLTDDARKLLEGLRPKLEQADEIGALYPMRRLVLEGLRGETPRRKRRADYDLQAELPFDWSAVEAGIARAIGAVADGSVVGVTRRLFAHEQRQGIRLIHALLSQYDVVLMNPPFGAPVPRTKATLKEWYPRAGVQQTNLYAAFVEQGLSLLRPEGLLGAITDRSGFFITTFQRFREDTILAMSEVFAFADLGFGVLGGSDEPAKVEAAAYCLRRRAVGGLK